MYRGSLQELLEAVFGFAVGQIRKGADDDAGAAEVVAGLRDGGSFHFDRHGVGEIGADG